MNTFLPAILAFFAGATSLAAQCSLQPIATGSGLPSLDGRAFDLAAWDPDGTGPLSEKLVVAGDFTLAGNLVTARVAAFDPVTNQFSPLGHIDRPPTFAVMPDGKLLAAAGGYFLPTYPHSTLLYWNGTMWHPFDPQPPVDKITAIAAPASGELFVSTFVVATAFVMRFDGNTWQTIGTATGATAARIGRLVVMPNGDLIVGGSFSAIDGVQAANVARWDGAAWTPLGAGVLGSVLALLATSNGELYAGGLFAVGTPSQTCNIARYNGTSWQSLGTGTQSTIPWQWGVFALQEMPGGSIVAGGQFDVVDGQAAYKVAQWDGTGWSPMGLGIEQLDHTGQTSIVWDLQPTANGELFAAGTFSSVSGRDGIGLARWNGASWSPIHPSGIGRTTTAIHRTSAGEVFLGGRFLDIDGVAHNGIARLTSTGWQPLGGGLGSYDHRGPIANTIIMLPSGDLIVGGEFPTAGGAVSPGIAQWDGAAWAPLGSGMSAPPGFNPRVLTTAVTANGDLLAAGYFSAADGIPVESIARWNGTAWSAVGTGLGGPGNVSVTCITVGIGGEIYASGSFGFGTRGVARFDGTTWQVIGTCGPNDQVSALLIQPNGDLLVGGSFSTIGGQPISKVARWSNGSWSSLGYPASYAGVRGLRQLPGGAVLAFGSSGTIQSFARWDGATWSLFAQDEFLAFDVAVDPAGTLLVAGSGSTFGGTPSANLLHVVAPCAASATRAGSGCTGSNGLVSLEAENLPWLGSSFQARAEGMPSQSIGAIVSGFDITSLPLSALLPQALTGCDLLVTPDLLELAVPTAGSLAIAIALPAQPALVGRTLHIQVVPFELDASSAIAAVTASNRLTLTLGQF